MHEQFGSFVQRKTTLVIFWNSWWFCLPFQIEESSSLVKSRKTEIPKYSYEKQEYTPLPLPQKGIKYSAFRVIDFAFSCQNVGSVVLNFRFSTCWVFDISLFSFLCLPINIPTFLPNHKLLVFQHYTCIYIYQPSHGRSYVIIISIDWQVPNIYSYLKFIYHCVQSNTATVVWFHFRLARMDVRTQEMGTFFENFVI